MKSRVIATLALIAYGAILIKVMVLKDVPLLRVGVLRLNFGGTHEGPPNFIPFKTILPYLLGNKGLIIAGINLLGNIIFLVPIGFLIPFVYRNIRWTKIFLLAIAAGLAIEGMQTLLHVGIFDIDDVLLNGVGVLAGYWMYMFVSKKLSASQPNKLILAAFVLLIGASTYLGIYFYQNHQLPVGFEPAVLNSPLHPVNNNKAGNSQDSQRDDLCGGTGGLGPIINIINHTLTVKRRDGVIQTIKLTKQTTIKTSAGVGTESDLKIGDRVTIVTGATPETDMTAIVVFVCKAPYPTPIK